MLCTSQRSIFYCSCKAGVGVHFMQNSKELQWKSNYHLVRDKVRLSHDHVTWSRYQTQLLFPPPVLSHPPSPLPL